MYKGTKTTFGELIIGDFFSMSDEVANTTQYKGYIPYIQMKVRSSVAIENIKPINNQDIAFNVVSLEDGRVRTFHNEQEVYKYNKEDILLKD